MSNELDFPEDIQEFEGYEYENNEETPYEKADRLIQTFNGYARIFLGAGKSIRPLVDVQELQLPLKDGLKSLNDLFPRSDKYSIKFYDYDTKRIAHSCTFDIVKSFSNPASYQGMSFPNNNQQFAMPQYYPPTSYNPETQRLNQELKSEIEELRKAKERMKEEDDRHYKDEMRRELTEMRKMIMTGGGVNPNSNNDVFDIIKIMIPLMFGNKHNDENNSQRFYLESMINDIKRELQTKNDPALNNDISKIFYTNIMPSLFEKVISPQQNSFEDAINAMQKIKEFISSESHVDENQIFNNSLTAFNKVLDTMGNKNQSQPMLQQIEGGNGHNPNAGLFTTEQVKEIQTNYQLQLQDIEKKYKDLLQQKLKEQENEFLALIDKLPNQKEKVNVSDLNNMHDPSLSVVNGSNNNPSLNSQASLSIVDGDNDMEDLKNFMNLLKGIIQTGQFTEQSYNDVINKITNLQDNNSAISELVDYMINDTIPDVLIHKNLDDLTKKYYGFSVPFNFFSEVRRRYNLLPV